MRQATAVTPSGEPDRVVIAPSVAYTLQHAAPLQDQDRRPPAPKGCLPGHRRRSSRVREHLWASVLALVIGLWPIDILAALIVVPYLAWVSFAAFLNWTIVQLNPPRSHEADIRA